MCGLTTVSDHEQNHLRCLAVWINGSRLDSSCAFCVLSVDFFVAQLYRLCLTGWWWWKPFVIMRCASAVRMLTRKSEKFGDSLWVFWLVLIPHVEKRSRCFERTFSIFSCPSSAWPITSSSLFYQDKFLSVCVCVWDSATLFFGNLRTFWTKFFARLVSSSFPSWPSHTRLRLFCSRLAHITTTTTANVAQSRSHDAPNCVITANRFYINSQNSFAVYADSSRGENKVGIGLTNLELKKVASK